MPPVLSRRRLLTLLAAGSTSLACGEPSAETMIRDAAERDPVLAAAIDRARRSAASVEARAPRGALGLPEPGERRRMPVAMFSALLGPLQLNHIANAFAAAEAASQGRYSFQDIPLDPITQVSIFDINHALDAVVGTAAPAELLVYFQSHHAELAANDRLLDLSEFIASDTAFDPEAYWPGLLAAGRHRGAQLALPVAVSPDVALLNVRLAASAEYPPPDPSRETFDREAFVNTALALRGRGASDAGAEVAGLIAFVDPEPRSTGDYVVQPEPTKVLLAALGSLEDRHGAFSPLTSEQAIGTVGFLRDLSTVHGLLRTDGFSFTPQFRNLSFGLWLGHLANVSPRYFGFRGVMRNLSRHLETGDLRVYPFPNLGSPANPVEIWAMIAIPASTADPAAAYQALRALGHGLRGEVAFPAQRVPAEALRQRMSNLGEADAQVVHDLLENAGVLTLSHGERSLIDNTIAREILLRGADPAQTLDALALELTRGRSAQA